MSTKYLGTGLDLGGAKITNSGSPSTATDLVPKSYVDNVAAGLSAKPSARAASTGNLTLSGTQTIDAVAVIVGDRVLAKNQTIASQNGIYVVASGAWALALDSTQGELSSGALVSISEGATNSPKSFVLTTVNPITVGTTSLVWSPFAAGSAYSAGNGLTLAASAFAINADGTSIIADGTSARVNPAYAGLAKRYAAFVSAGATTVTMAHGLATSDLVVTVQDASGNTVQPDIQVTSTNIVLVFATAPTANQYRVIAIG